MDIVITHEGTDFDGLAAMIAVTKLMPGTIPVFPGYLSNQVKDFMALFKNEFEVKRAKDIDFQKVKHLILVDTKDPSRVGPFSELLYNDQIKRIVYDHHILDTKRFDFDYEDFTEEVGATTTMLVERIMAKELPITPMEATLFALGIYHDTGCLTFSTTTPKDAEMVAFLLRNGAKLNVVEEFVEFALTETQLEVLNLLMDNIENISVHGLRVDVYSAVLPQYLLGISQIIHKLRDIKEADLYFVIVEMEGRVIVVARSDIESVHLGDFLSHFGGGGHAGAASAVIKKSNLFDVKTKLIKMLNQYINQPRLARDIMTTPVKIISPDATIRQAEEIMLRYGHSGLIVMDENKLKGIFSRRDLDKIKKHNLYDVPIKGYMTRKVITISPDIPVSEVQRLLVAHDIGRLPVVDENDDLLGIITRSDLLKVLYGEEMSVKKKYYGSSLVEVNPRFYNIQYCLIQSSPELYELLCQIRDISENLKVKPYLVGGFVRDLLLQHPSTDLDIVVEGDGIAFAQELHKILGGNLNIYQEFGTATIEIESFQLDIATARVEYYEYPAALPQVEPGQLKQDLHRRDFTINTLALSLTKEKFGWLIDFFGGQKDLKMQIIRGLHSFTFIDDPTRIIRGLRFAVRFGFKIEAETKNLMLQAIEFGAFKQLKGGRVWEELRALLLENDVEKIILYLNEYGILHQISSELTLTENQLREIKRVNWVMKLLREQCSRPVHSWLLILMVLFQDLPLSESIKIASNWNLGQDFQKRLAFVSQSVSSLIQQLLKPDLKSSQIFQLLEPLYCEELMYLLLVSDSKVILERVMDFLQRLRRIDLEISGNDIIDLGLSPGPLFKELISQTKKAKLDGQVNSYLEELEFIKMYLREKRSGCDV